MRVGDRPAAGHERVRVRARSPWRAHVVRPGDWRREASNDHRRPSRRHRRRGDGSSAANRRQSASLRSHPDELWAQNRALLPVRFGTVVRDASDLDLIVGQLPDALREQLAGVRDRAQMTILVLLSPRPRTRVTRRSPISGAEYLRAAQAAHDVPGFAPLRAALRRWVRGERVETRGDIASVYHLVPRGAVGRYRAAAMRAGKDAGIRLRVLGPRPPYAFADRAAVQLMGHGEATR